MSSQGVRPSGGGSGRPPKAIPIQAIHQQAGNWCWAACAEMLQKFRDPGYALSQCDIAERWFRLIGANVPSAGCCQNPADTDCNRTLKNERRSMPLVVRPVGTLSEIPTPDPTKVANHVGQGRPVLCCLFRTTHAGLSPGTSPGSHFVIVVRTASPTFLTIIDPNRAASVYSVNTSDWWTPSGVPTPLAWWCRP